MHSYQSKFSYKKKKKMNRSIYLKRNGNLVFLKLLGRRQKELPGWPACCLGIKWEVPQPKLIFL